tara:strand:- start:1980 stop:2624 length:645 start_codon:yes stop_codon:yes gene_type:complete
MGIQTIIDNAQYITVDKRRVSAQTISRSGRIKTAEVASAVPYRFKVGMHSGLTYSTNRGLLEDLDALDRTQEETIDIGKTNTGLSYITAYQGDSSGIHTLTINSATGNELYVNATNAGSGTFLFKKGDFIQPSGTYRYPYQITADVAHTTGANVTLPLHRAFITQAGYTLGGKTIDKGVDVDFAVKMIQKPGYSIVPNDRIEFDTDFDLIEVIE